jgi:hypothetical protein
MFSSSPESPYVNTLLFTTENSHTYEIDFTFEKGGNFPSTLELQAVFFLYYNQFKYKLPVLQSSNYFNNVFLLKYGKLAPGVSDLYFIFERNSSFRQQNIAHRESCKYDQICLKQKAPQLVYATEVRPTQIDNYDDVCDLMFFTANDNPSMICFDNDKIDGKPFALQSIYDLSESNLKIVVKNAAEVKSQRMLFRVFGIDEDDVFPLYLDHVNPSPGPDPDPSKNLLPKCRLAKDYLGIDNNLFPLYRNMILQINERFIIDLNDVYEGLNVTYANLPINRSD